MIEKIKKLLSQCFLQNQEIDSHINKTTKKIKLGTKWMFSIQHHFLRQTIFNHANIPNENGHKHYKTLNIFNRGWTTNLSTT
jgi:hypothetical protein